MALSSKASRRVRQANRFRFVAGAICKCKSADESAWPVQAQKAWQRCCRSESMCDMVGALRTHVGHNRPWRR
eukprot:5496978-Alexandrium_andersonii.AAC.1